MTPSSSYVGLTAEELTCLLEASSGASISQISMETGFSVAEVKAHLAKVLERVKVLSRTH